MKRSEYLDSALGRRHRRSLRLCRHLRILVEDIEPRGKKGMSLDDKLSFQRQVVEQMEDLRRKAFKGPILLKMSLSTTDANPNHAHTVTKNLLDLLSSPLPKLASTRRSLLYKDDRQVEALSVTCHHGEDAPRIYISAVPMKAFTEDLELAHYILSESRYNLEEETLRQKSDAALDHFNDLIRDEARYSSLLGKDGYDSWLYSAKQRAQEALLDQHARLTVEDLIHLYDVTGIGRLGSKNISPVLHQLAKDIRSSRDKMFCATPFRILLEELPQEKGSSDQYKATIEREIQEFQARFRRLLEPLLIPVALEAVIKPPPPSRTRALHDLDNVLRNYLIPRVVETFKPPSDIAWTINLDQLNQHTQYWEDKIRSMPASTKTGLTRFEAWRLPRSESDTSPGFVSLAVVHDPAGMDSILHRLNKLLENWEEEAEDL